MRPNNNPKVAYFRFDILPHRFVFLIDSVLAGIESRSERDEQRPTFHPTSYTLLITGP